MLKNEGKKINGKYWSSYVHRYIVFLCIIYCVTNAVAVMYSWNIPKAEKRIVCFQSKNAFCRFFFYISNNYYIYLKIHVYFDKFVTNDY